MAYANLSDPFQLLRELDQKSRERSGGLPAREGAEEGWTGVLFRLGDNELLVSMEDITEIVPLQALTTIPATRSWLLGVMNLRGSLLPVVDLEGYLFGKNLPGTDLRSRLLVIQYDGYPVGLLVRGVHGMKHYRKDDASVELPRIDKEIHDCISGAYERLQAHYAVFDVDKLVNSERFRQIAA